MSLSYSGIVGSGSGKATLPSVEGAFGTMNILREPNKGIFTSKRTKVGEDNLLLNQVDEGTDRACENIRVYARGSNPMVGVSFNNSGNNGGNRANGSGITEGGNTQAFMPYRILQDGAFRPPILSQEQLLPLSRQNRAWTYVDSTPGFVDFSKKLVTCGDAKDYRAVKNRIAKMNIQPTATRRLEQSPQETYEVKNVIKNPIRVAANSGIRTMDITTQHVGVPTREIADTLQGSYSTNYSGLTQDGDVNFNTAKYTQNVLHGSYNTNASQNIGVNVPREGYVDIHTKEAFNYGVNSGVAIPGAVNMKSAEVAYDRNMPMYSASTNIGDLGKYVDPVRNDQVLTYNNSRNMPKTSFQTNLSGLGVGDFDQPEYRLKPTLTYGGFAPEGTRPQFQREHMNITLKDRNVNRRHF